eukprot:351470_1
MQFISIVTLYLLNNVFISVQTAWCQDHYQCVTGNPLNTGKAFCIGYFACALTDIVATDFLLCYGDNGCRGDNKHISAPLSAQTRTTLQSSAQIECTGTKSCHFTEISATTTVSCKGAESCANSIIQSGNGYDVSCDSVQSCYSSQIQTGKDVQCNAEESCAGWSNIVTSTATGSQRTVYCKGPLSCKTATINAAVVKVDGYRAAVYSSVTPTADMMVFGREGIQNAIIWGSVGSNLRVTVLGFNAGQQANIICPPQVHCEIYCWSNGCTGLTVTCQQGSICNIYAVSTNSVQQCTSSHTFYDGSQCPNIQNTVPGFDMDNFIKKIKDGWLTDPDYNQYNEKRKNFEEINRHSEPDNHSHMYYDTDVIISITIMCVVFLMGVSCAATFVYYRNGCQRKEISIK